MALTRFTGFNTGDLREFVSVGTTQSIQSSIVRNGPFALRCNPTTTATGFGQLGMFNTDGSLGSLPATGTNYVRFYFRFATAPASGDEPLFDCGATSFELRLDSTGILKAYNAAGTLISTGTTVLSSGQWYRIEVKKATSSRGSSVAWEFKIDGVSEASGTANVGGGNTPRLGKTVNRNSNSVDFFYTDYAFSSTGYPGAGQCALMKTRSDGGSIAWTFNGTTRWQSVNEVPPNDDTTYINSLVTLDVCSFNMDSCATAGISGTINGQCTLAFASENLSTFNGTVIVQTVSGGTTAATTGANTLAAPYQICGLISELDPNTAAAWTTEALDAITPAVKSNSVNNSRVTAIYSLVDYTPPSVGSIAGTSTVSASGTSLASDMGEIFGTSTVAATSASLVDSPADGVISGSSTTAASSGSLANSDVLTSGNSTVLGIGTSLAITTGSVGGTCLVVGVGADTAAVEGACNGTVIAGAISGSLSASAGASFGTSIVESTAVSQGSSLVLVSGVSIVSATSNALTSAVGLIAGSSIVGAISGGIVPTPSTEGGEVEGFRRRKKPRKQEPEKVLSIKQDDAEAIALAWLMLGDR